MIDLDDTIAALGSAAGGAARGIVRVTGPNTQKLVGAVFKPHDVSRWSDARHAMSHAGEMELDGFTARLPVTVMLWPNRRSYTGQPQAELQCVGSPPLLEATLTSLYRRGVRPARPGEFTLRAFLAGRIDLTQAEAVLGVIDAEDHVELETALEQLAGGLSGELAEARRDLIELLADLEAGLDFVEEDIEFVSRAEVRRRLDSIQSSLQALHEQAAGRMRSDGCRRVVLAGLPNAGKSTLFNALTGEAAIVSHVSGTTRDFLTCRVTWEGLELELVDTAGWEPTGEGIMRMAESQRDTQNRRADCLVSCLPPHAAGDPRHSKFTTELSAMGVPVIRVATKSDLLERQPDVDAISVSAHTKTGLEELRASIVKLFTDQQKQRRSFVGSTAARSRESLESAAGSIQNAITATEDSTGDEFLAFEIREALQHLGKVLGTVYTDDVLDRVFSKFCIGK